ncbi:MAG: hypothetical protein OXM61_02860 [Candidatus Poribacteria bacterium]|nr:hypothetical protein [Candidatus Poribacteria bacterium]
MKARFITQGRRVFQTRCLERLKSGLGAFTKRAYQGWWTAEN